MARRTADLGMGIARRLKQAQKAAELTVRELAEWSHVTAPTIMKIRNGGGGGMAIGLLVDVARALGVAPEWLVFGRTCKDEED
jgi:transcriptional regulator with XRE-family HTH domain